MGINVVLPSELSKVDKQIMALESIIPKDNEKDKTIHIDALNKLKAHRKNLIKS